MLETWQIYRFFAGFIGFHFIGLLSEHLFKGTFKRYNFTKENEVAWNSRIVSTVHAVLLGQVALRCVIYYCHDDPVNGGCQLLNDYFPISLGYLVYDLILCLMNPKLREFSMLVHHTVTITLELWYLETQYGVLWSSLYLLFEVTTPFLNLLYHLRKLELDTVYFRSCMTVFVVFYFMWIIFRCYSCVYLMYQTFMLWDQILLLTFARRAFIIGSLSIFTTLNFYWFYLIQLKLSAKIQEATKTVTGGSP
eukprot:TRINITY_DN7018_c0_g1_i1.p1 TRINITY_DN7018_c0_g1~~TRINITY_DN7018_c0_g1_i1.p1  ORF type:complete len:250 (+),score=28.42 TRINITY_DN7018_c0_g1_i1:31-780(+)